MTPYARAALALAAAAALSPAHAQNTPAPQPVLPAPPAEADAPTTLAQADAPVRHGGIVVVTAAAPSSLPARLPSTIEGIDAAQIARSIFASDSEDALKYLPSLLVRKRYIGDYNHAILSSRASGTGNSARSAVYADGLLLSNYLGNGVSGLSFPPRWGLVAPEEIERVDVLYGPFSAAYPGNSVGAVVVYVTRMPTAFEAHAKVGVSQQRFNLYDTHGSFPARETSASLGNRSGAFAWRLSFQHSDSHGQPLTFATRLLSAGKAGTAGSGGTAVSGAVPDANNAGSPWLVLGTGTEFHTRQDQLKARLAYDLSPTLRLNWLLGVWQNQSAGEAVSYLRDSAGRPVTSGAINVDGWVFGGAQALGGGDFALTRERLTHVMQGLVLKQHSGGRWDWEVSASRYDYRRDDKRQNAAANPLPAAASGGAGTLADGHGSGWTNLAAKATWRPTGRDGAHVVDVGLQQDDYTLRYRSSAIGGNWLVDDAGSLASEVRGRTRLTSAWGQDTWVFAPGWHAVLGLRAEQWQALDGRTAFSATSALAHPSRREQYLSPKAAVAWQASPLWVLKASLGRAVRMPTVSELYGATSTANSQVINDPNLAPERSWTGELSAEFELDRLGQLRLTGFGETTRDALYSQTLYDASVNKNISRVQNIGRIATTGFEMAYSGTDLLRPGIDLSASLTYADSLIKDNAGFVAVPGDTLGKRQPNIPRWRASALAAWRFAAGWTASFGARYSGPQFRTLNNADINGFTYQGVSKYLTTDVRLHWRIDRQWSAAVGIDNLNNARYWNFHPYPQRSVNAELKFDL